MEQPKKNISDPEKNLSNSSGGTQSVVTKKPNSGTKRRPGLEKAQKENREIAPNLLPPPGPGGLPK